MLIPVEKHDGHWVEEFVHRVELGYLVDVAEVDYGEVWLGVSHCEFLLAGKSSFGKEKWIKDFLTYSSHVQRS